MLKIGDKIIIRGTLNIPFRIATIVRVSKSFGYESGYNPKSWHKDKRHKIKQDPATPESISAAEEIIAKRKAKEDEIRTANTKLLAERTADPRYKYIERFSNGLENWHKLTLEQLKTLAEWLDSKEVA